MLTQWQFQKSIEMTKNKKTGGLNHRDFNHLTLKHWVKNVTQWLGLSIFDPKLG